MSTLHILDVFGIYIMLGALWIAYCWVDAIRTTDTLPPIVIHVIGACVAIAYFKFIRWIVF
jgi:hypothetical protein